MEPLLDKAGLARVLNVPPGWVKEAITARSIPITWVGRHARFSAEDVAEIVAAGKEQPADMSPALRLVPGQPRPAAPPRPAGPPTPSKRGRVA